MVVEMYGGGKMFSWQTGSREKGSTGIEQGKI
jgi:hypothetical protein